MAQSLLSSRFLGRNSIQILALSPSRAALSQRHCRHFMRGASKAVLTLPSRQFRRTLSNSLTSEMCSMTTPKNIAHQAHNTWVGSNGAAAFDLRSDTMTTPTASMLAAIQTCSLLDDVFMEDPTTSELEAYVAALTGKEAALFVLSGTMGNQLALRSLLTQPPHGILLDHRSHVVKYEAGGAASLSGAQIMPVTPRNGIHLTLADVLDNAVIDDDCHSCPTRVISLENTLNGMVIPVADVREIHDFAVEHGIKLHLDGARLWEAVVAGAGQLDEYCSYFDTVSLCFSKGLGAPIGSILVGSKALIKQARWVRKAIGGGLRQSGVVTAPARVALDETFHGGLLKASHEVAQHIGQLWTSLGGKLIHPVHTNMCWLDLEVAGCSNKRFEDLGKREGLRLMGNRVVVHYQTAQRATDVMPRLERIFASVFKDMEGTREKDATGANMYRT